jgi:hypothetical protein
MKTSSRDSPAGPEDLSRREVRSCPVCGTTFSATEANESCPVCMLRKALADRADSGASLPQDTVRPPPEYAKLRFEHYEIVLSEEGKPLELGRGAMGITRQSMWIFNVP